MKKERKRERERERKREKERERERERERRREREGETDKQTLKPAFFRANTTIISSRLSKRALIFFSFFLLFSFDILWLTKVLSDIGTSHYQMVPGKGELPYISGSPKLLLRDSQTPITLSFHFTCPDGVNCDSCGMKDTKQRPPPCPYSRRIVFLDSCLHLKSSLANCISDLNNLATETNTPLSQIFATTFAFATDAGYTETQFQTLVSAKMQFPFSLCTSISSLKEWTSIPPKEYFQNKLSNQSSVSQSSYDTFCHIWKVLGFSSLLDCLWVYSLVDSTSLADAIKYHYVEIWRKTGLFPGFYLTAASLALASFLFNTRDPRRNKNGSTRPIMLEFLPEQAETVIKSSLNGGYTSNNALFKFFSNGLKIDHSFSTGIYIDANAL